jgi:hypothetical protein
MNHGVAVVDGELHWHDVQTFGDPARMGYLRRLSGRPIAETMDIDPSWVSAINRFSEVTDDEFRHTSGYKNLWVPMECISLVAMNAVVDDVHAWWVAAHRVRGQSYFGAEVVKRLQRRADAYVHCLDVARRLEGERIAGRGLVLLTSAGEISFACEVGREWLRNDALLARIREVVRARETIAPFSAHNAIVRLTSLMAVSAFTARSSCPRIRGRSQSSCA